MKWFFAVNAATFDHQEHDWNSMIQAAVCSARRNTWLQPNCIFDGPPNKFTSDLKTLGVNVIFHRSTLYESMLAQGPSFPLAVAAGCYLRIDIPWLEPDEDFVLYTDCDVLFRSHPSITSLRPKLFACAPQMIRGDYNDMNSGVMLINVKGMRRELPGFSQFIRENLARLGHWDQNALIEFFSGRYDLLPDELNWKPYWGSNTAAEVIHFHGPKPGTVSRALADPAYPMNEIWQSLFDRDHASYVRAVEEWNGYLFQAQSYLKLCSARVS